MLTIIILSVLFIFSRAEDTLEKTSSDEGENLITTLVPDFDEKMLIKLSKLPDLDEKYGNRSLTKSNFTTFMYENFDLFGNMAREVFIESGQSEELTDFIIEVMRLGSTHILHPVSVSRAVQASLDFRHRWRKLPEADKQILRKLTPTMANAIGGPA